MDGRPRRRRLRARPSRGRHLVRVVPDGPLGPASGQRQVRHRADLRGPHQPRPGLHRQRRPAGRRPDRLSRVHHRQRHSGSLPGRRRRHSRGRHPARRRLLHLGHAQGGHPRAMGRRSQQRAVLRGTHHRRHRAPHRGLQQLLRSRGTRHRARHLAVPRRPAGLGRHRLPRAGGQIRQHLRGPRGRHGPRTAGRARGFLQPEHLGRVHDRRLPARRTHPRGAEGHG